MPKPMPMGAAAPPPMPDLVEDDMGEGGSELGAVMMDLMPWGLSFLMHASVVLLTLFVLWTASGANISTDETPNSIITMPPGGGGGGQGGGGNIGEINNPNKVLQANAYVAPQGSNTPTRQITQKNNTSSSLVPRSHNPYNSPMNFGSVTQTTSGASGGKGSRIFHGGPGFGDGTGYGIGSGDGTHGGSGSGSGGGIGSGHGTGRGPGTGEGDAGPTRYAFIIDASGSLIEGMPFVINELIAFIYNLPSTEEFCVVFFQNDKVIIDVTKGSYLRASDINKRYAIDRLANIHPQGTSNPEAAINLIFNDAKRPPAHIAYILSDNITGSGQYEIRRDALLNLMEMANPVGGKVDMINGKPNLIPPATIHAIQFLYPDPLSKQGFKNGTLDELVAQNNARIREFYKKHLATYKERYDKNFDPDKQPIGTYRYVDPKEMFGTEK